MAARLERKHYERAAVYAARGEWRKCASHVARAVAFGSIEDLRRIDDDARSATFRRVEKGSRECVPSETGKGRSRTACAFRQCDSEDKCETDFTQCYVQEVVRLEGKAPAYKCRGRYGKTKNEPEGRRTCTYSIAHGKCKLDQLRDYAFENARVCTYDDGKCKTTDKTKAVEFAKEYFHRKGAEQAEESGRDAASTGPGSSTLPPARSPGLGEHMSPAHKDAQIAEQGRHGALLSADEEPTSAARISSEHDARGAGPQKLPAKRMSTEQRNLAAFNALSPDEERPLGPTRSRR
jgi:hypothetical protein